jgi:putative ABC transport system permease protein
MFGYYLELAVRSLKRNIGLTTLMVLSISVGVALAMTTWTLVHMMSRDPIPYKSAHLFIPTVDAWGPSAETKDNEPPSLFGYATATALMRDHRARFQSAVYWVNPTVIPTQAAHNHSLRQALLCPANYSRCSVCHSSTVVAGVIPMTRPAHKWS